MRFLLVGIGFFGNENGAGYRRKALTIIVLSGN